MRIATTFFRWFAVLVIISFAMAVVQWLTAPEGYGASGWGNALSQFGHRKLGELLRSLSDVRAFGVVSGICERFINAPRNHLLHDLGYLYQAESTYYYATPHRLLTDDWRSVLMFGSGTVVVYLPLIIGVALIRRSGWRVMKEPVLISSLLFVAVTIVFLGVSESDEPSKRAVIFMALSLLTAAVSISWSPIISRRRRFAALALLLVICSIVGMFAVTRGSGPGDGLSYPVFFGWSLCLLLLEGGSFLLLVWLLLRMVERRRGDVAPPPRELGGGKESGSGHRAGSDRNIDHDPLTNKLNDTSGPETRATTMGEVSGVRLEEVSVTGHNATFPVTVDSTSVGLVSFMKYYEPVLKAMEPYVALWAGPTLCVIDRTQKTMHCVDRGDETHRVHSFEALWIVEGELNVDLFDPRERMTLATYGHNEVIMGSSVVEGLVHIRDFAGATVTLDPHRSLQVVRSRPETVTPHE